MILRLLIAIVALSICSTSAFAQEDIFWSFGTGADISSTATVDVSEGSGSAYVYVREDLNPGGVDAFDLDFSVDTNDVIQVTNIELLDFVIPGSNPPENFRWFDPDEPVDVSLNVDGNGVASGRLFGVGVLSNGLNPFFASAGLDPFFDSVADGAPISGFQLARLDYDILSEGVADFSLSLGTQGIVEVLGGGGTLDLNPSFGTGTLTVTNVPEPTSAGLLVLGLAGFVARRRR